MKDEYMRTTTNVLAHITQARSTTTLNLNNSHCEHSDWLRISFEIARHDKRIHKTGHR